jgi:hypothetical protein
MPPKQDDEDRERPSWREIDQRRDRGTGARPAKEPRKTKTQKESSRKQALAQAEALFKGKRALPGYQTALKALETHHGTKKFAATAKKFLEEYGLPEEWGALHRLLDYPDQEVALEVIQTLAKQAQSRTRVEQQGFKGRLQILALTSPYGEVRRTAEQILADW